MPVLFAGARFGLTLIAQHGFLVFSDGEGDRFPRLCRRHGEPESLRVPIDFRLYETPVSRRSRRSEYRAAKYGRSARNRFSSSLKLFCR